MEVKCLDCLYECLRNILLQAKTPVKYLLATSILRMTESKVSWRDKEEVNVLTLLKVLYFNIKSLDDGQDLMEGPNCSLNRDSLSLDLHKKALKYSLIAVTNILIKTSPEFLFSRKVNLN